MTRERYQATDKEIQWIIHCLTLELNRRLEEKGKGIFVSLHEILGVIDEEHDEFKDAVHDNTHGEAYKELLDIAVGAVFGALSIRSGEMDW